MNNFFSISGAALTIIWGVAHLFPTNNVIKNFGEISEDNKRILRMEWINEGLTLIFLGSVIIAAIIVKKIDVVKFLSISVIVMLLSMSVLSLFTGVKNKFIVYKLCPIIFGLAAVCIAIGVLL